MTAREHPSEARAGKSCTCEAPHVNMADAGITDLRCPIHGSPPLVAHWEAVHLTPRVEPYRDGNHNPRNIYRSGVDRDTDEQIGVMFTPEMGRLVVVALNALAGGPDA